MLSALLPYERYLHLYLHITSTFLVLQMEFSFGPYKWLPRELLHERRNGSENYALGLHAPGYFDKVLNVDMCLLQTDPANKV